MRKKVNHTMKNILNILSLLVICIAPILAADSKPTLPGKVAYEKALDDATKVFTQAKLKALDKFKKDLKKALADEVKAGNLDSANAINLEVKALDDEQAKLTGMDDVNPKVALLGKWLVTRTDGHVGVWIFKEDQTVVMDGKNFNGKWAIEGTVAKIVWMNDPTKWDTFTLPVSDKTSGDGWNIPKGGLSATRQK